MNWFRRHLGMDFVDVAIQVFVTGLMMGFVDETAHGPASDGLMFVIPAVSAVIFAGRRSLALKRAAREPEGLTTGQMEAARLEELENRVAELEGAHSRVAELEERLDFAERLLAQGTGERALPPGNRAP
jgi:hypothetical protein